ncbi:MAG: PQQ-binding-like beta-propeller repeat protein, partial [Acidobacteriota bacterium]
MVKPIGCSLLVLTVLHPLVSAQILGDQFRAGFTNSRTDLNSDLGDFHPPLELDRTIPISQLSYLQSLIVFERHGRHYLLIRGFVGEDAAYQAFDAETGDPIWPQAVLFGPLPGEEPFRYTPATNGDLVLLGGPGETSIKLVRVLTGETLWSDKTIGDVQRREPLLTHDLAFYGGTQGLVAADPVSGTVRWRDIAPPAESPLSVLQERVFYVDYSGTLRCRRLRDGATIWHIPSFGTGNPHLIATEKSTFYSVGGRFGAINTTDGTRLWDRDFPNTVGPPLPEFSETPPLALAYDLLFLFTSDLGVNFGGSHEDMRRSAVTAHSPETGELVWTGIESGAGIDYGSIGNNLIVYFKTGWYQSFYYGEVTKPGIRIREAFTGDLLWSVDLEGVRTLSLALGNLFVLLPDRVAVFRNAREQHTYFAHIAVGLSQRTLFDISNPSEEPAAGSLRFIDSEGQALRLPLVDHGTASEVSFLLPPGGKSRIVTEGGNSLLSGWAQISSEVPLNATATLQYKPTQGPTLGEALVGSSGLVSRASFFAERSMDTEGRWLSTALALANPTDKVVYVRLTLRDPDGSYL